MNTRDQIHVLTYLFSVVNGFFLIIGLTEMGYGMWILYDKNSFLTALVYADTEHNVIMDIAYILLCAGILISFPCFLGYLGVMKESRFLLILDMAIIFQMSILQFTIVILLLSPTDKIKLKLLSNFEILITEYGNYSLLDEKKNFWELLNVVQTTNACCGISNSSDWKKNEYVAKKQKIPCSCTTSDLKKWFCEPSQYEIYPRGCASVIIEWFFNNMYGLIGIECGLFILEMVFKTMESTSLKHVISKDIGSHS